MSTIDRPKGTKLQPPATLPLENGDRLTRDEFMRRYSAPNAPRKAELIEGVVHVSSPVSKPHAESCFAIIAWLGAYVAATPGVFGGDNGTVFLDGDNVFQPDAVLCVRPQSGGQTRETEEKYLVGAPEMAIEVAASSASVDLHAKKSVYRRCGVSEYLVWRVLDQAVDWFVLEHGEYRPLASDAGVLKGRIFPGLWLDVAALLASDLKLVLATLQGGMNSPEHGSFVQGLRRDA
jgi:Uma2 family endonuclease